MLKVVFIIGIAGACRCDELTRMSVNDVEDKNSVLMIRIPDSKTHKPRRFIVVGDADNEINNTLYRKYRSLCLTQMPHRRLLLNYKNGKCSTQAVGIHTFEKIPSKVAAYLGLASPEEYTGHCLRRSSATLLVDTGADMPNLKRHGGWKSSSVAEGYIEDSLENKLMTAKQIVGGKEETNTEIRKDGVAAGSSKFELSHLTFSDENNYVVKNKNALSGINISNVQKKIKKF